MRGNSFIPHNPYLLLSSFAKMEVTAGSISITKRINTQK